MTLRPLLAGCALAALCLGPVTAQTPDLYDETVLRTFDLTFAQSNWYTLLQQNYGTGVDLAANLTVDGVLYPNVGVRFRGGSSYSFIGSSQKKPFGIAMDAFMPGQRLYGYDSLNLNNGYLDPTFVREALVYNVFRTFMTAGRANFVVLRVNGQDWGVYVNVQQPDKTMLRQWFVDEDGARFEADALLPGAVQNGSSLTWLGSTATAYMNNYELKTPSLPQPWTPLIDVCSALNQTSLANLTAALDPRFCIDEALRMIAGQIVFVNPDSYVTTGHNYYVYHDPYHNRVHTIPWGMNLPLGASFLAGSTTAQRASWSLFANSTNTGRPLLARLWAVPALRERYLAHARTLVEQHFDWAILQPRIAAYQSLIAAAVAADPKKLYPTAAFTSNLTADYVAGFTTISALRTLIQSRRTYLLGHAELQKPAPTVGNVGHQPASPSFGTQVWINATIVGNAAPVGSATLYSRAIGAYQQSPMFDDGMHMDGAANDGVYGAALPAYPPGSFVDYYVAGASTAAAGGAMTFGPRTGPVRINEFLAQNDTVLPDPFGEYDDWLELVNTSPVAIDLSGMHLTDSLQNPTKFTFPAGTTIAANGTLLVWCDEDGTQGPLHANFKLAAGGEEVALFAVDGQTLLDHRVFGPQQADISTGRLRDAGTPWVTFPVPTPAARNQQPGCGVRRYSGQSYTSQTMTLAVSGTTGVGGTFAFDVAGSPLVPGLMMIALLPDHVALPGIQPALLVQPGSVVVQTIALDGAGTAAVPLVLPADPGLAGVTVYGQAAAFVGGGIAGSNGVEVVVCP